MDGSHGSYFMQHQDELTDMAKARVMSHMSKSAQTKAFNNLAHKLNNMFPMRDDTNNDRTFKKAAGQNTKAPRTQKQDSVKTSSNTGEVPPTDSTKPVKHKNK